jgi:hypothetical protein
MPQGGGKHVKGGAKKKRGKSKGAKKGRSRSKSPRK